MVGELLRQSIVSATTTKLPSGKGVQQRYGAPRNDDIGREHPHRDGISSRDCVLSGHVGGWKGRMYVTTESSLQVTHHCLHESNLIKSTCNV